MPGLTKIFPGLTLFDLAVDPASQDHRALIQAVEALILELGSVDPG
jgi:hypothetical protein